MARAVQPCASARVLVHWRRSWYQGSAVYVCFARVWFCFLSVPDLLAMVCVVAGFNGSGEETTAKTILGDRFSPEAGTSGDHIHKY